MGYECPLSWTPEYHSRVIPMGCAERKNESHTRWRSEDDDETCLDGSGHGWLAGDRLERCEEPKTKPGRT